MLLAIDTASRLMSLALHDGRQVLYEATWHTANNHTIELVPAIHQAMSQLQLMPADLKAVAVSQGPGSFTGLRIGMGVAKGLALAQNLQFVAIPTLPIIAAGVPGRESPLVAVLQAGRGRICTQRFEWRDDRWQPLSGAEITSWQKLVAVSPAGTAFAGEIDDHGWAEIQRPDRHLLAIPGAYGLRRAGMLAELAWQRIAAGEPDDPATVTPIYLHQPGVPHP